MNQAQEIRDFANIFMKMDKGAQEIVINELGFLFDTKNYPNSYDLE